MTTISERTEPLTTAERYEHILSVIEAQICTEAWRVSQYEDIDPQTAAAAKARWGDWTVLRDAIGRGLMDGVLEDYAALGALVGGVL